MDDDILGPVARQNVTCFSDHLGFSGRLAICDLRAQYRKFSMVAMQMHVKRATERKPPKQKQEVWQRQKQEIWQGAGSAARMHSASHIHLELVCTVSGLHLYDGAMKDSHRGLGGDVVQLPAEPAPGAQPAGQEPGDEGADQHDAHSHWGIVQGHLGDGVLQMTARRAKRWWSVAEVLHAQQGTKACNDNFQKRGQCGVPLWAGRR